MKEEKNTHPSGKKALTAGVAVLTAAGLVLGGTFTSPDELLQDEDSGNIVLSDTLTLSAADGGSGGDDTDGFGSDTDDDDDSQYGKKRSLSAALQKRILRLPFALRLTVLLPLWLLGHGLIVLGGWLLSIFSPGLQNLLGTVLGCAAAGAALCLAAKAAFPNLPLKKIFRKRTLLISAAVLILLIVADRLAVFFSPRYADFRTYLISGLWALFCAVLLLSAAFRLCRSNTSAKSHSHTQQVENDPPLNAHLVFTDSSGSFSLETP